MIAKSSRRIETGARKNNALGGLPLANNVLPKMSISSQ
jgi:hypothetical protein